MDPFVLVHEPNDVSLSPYLRGTAVMDEGDHRGSSGVVPLTEAEERFQFSSSSVVQLHKCQLHTVDLVWLSLGPILEHGARRYESQVQKLGVLRRHRSHQDFPEAAIGRGTYTEERTTNGAAVLSPNKSIGYGT
ncbi:hypothetical protein M5K25_018896 [Dendrobium thyrsiflorum]|uniref:Uncharacterized protein n=1 Tax=Dendrobium thyrsiflorum TaxID=117978 RepID=A0ABD0UKF4_DENTH